MCWNKLCNNSLLDDWNVFSIYFSHEMFLWMTTEAFVAFVPLVCILFKLLFIFNNISIYLCIRFIRFPDLSILFFGLWIRICFSVRVINGSNVCESAATAATDGKRCQWLPAVTINIGDNGTDEPLFCSDRPLVLLLDNSKLDNWLKLQTPYGRGGLWRRECDLVCWCGHLSPQPVFQSLRLRVWPRVMAFDWPTVTVTSVRLLVRNANQ